MTRLLKRAREEQGFTLIELMVVILIIGILVAIALPTFLGARARAQDRAAQSDLRNSLVAAKTLLTDTGDYTTATSAGLGGVESNIVFVAAGTAVTAATGVSAGPLAGTTPAGTTWGAARMSQSGTCFLIKDVTTTGTKYGTTVTAANCTGTFAATGTNANLAAW